jgi:hypothetical protein
LSTILSLGAPNNRATTIFRFLFFTVPIPTTTTQGIVRHLAFSITFLYSFFFPSSNQRATPSHRSISHARKASRRAPKAGRVFFSIPTPQPQRREVLGIKCTQRADTAVERLRGGMYHIIRQTAGKRSKTKRKRIRRKDSTWLFLFLVFFVVLWSIIVFLLALSFYFYLTFSRRATLVLFFFSTIPIFPFLN